jgi:hypothetical protein
MVCMYVYFSSGGQWARKVPYWGTGRAELGGSIYDFSAKTDNRPHYPAYHRHKRRIVSSLLPVSGMTRRGLETVAARQACDQDGYVGAMGVRGHGQMEGVAASPI